MTPPGDSDVQVAVVIPALNEEQAIGRVIVDLSDTKASRVVVVDNGSRDATSAVAVAAGAEVIKEPERGYGAACLAGIRHLESEPPDVVVFLDGDYSDHPEELDQLIAPILEGRAELVIGSRIRGGARRDALLLQARFGNWLSCHLIRLFFGVQFTDLGPFRAITWCALQRLAMADRDFGWTVEMQVKAAKLKVKTAEIPVRYRPRIGKSKISGTVVGSVRAGHKILWTIFREKFFV